MDLGELVGYRGQFSVRSYICGGGSVGGWGGVVGGE